jgi:hypothetical protein
MSEAADGKTDGCVLMPLAGLAGPVEAVPLDEVVGIMRWHDDGQSRAHGYRLPVDVHRGLHGDLLCRNADSDHGAVVYQVNRSTAVPGVHGAIHPIDL